MSDIGEQKLRGFRAIEICTDFGTGGIARHAIDLQRWLNAHGHEVWLGGMAGEWAGPDTEPAFLEMPVRWVAGDGGNILVRLAYAAICVARMRRWLRRHPVDVIHAHESAPALVALLAARGTGIPVIVTYHGSEPDRIKSFGTIARRADLVITPSHSSGEDLVQIGGVPHEKLEVIGLGIRPPPPHDPADVAALRKDLIGDGRRLVVSIARIAHQKGIDILVQCVERLKTTRPDLRFVVVGEGPLEREMHDLAERKGVLTHIRFVGRSEEPFRYLHAADLMLLTSRWESLPITIVEAFQAGLPVVATDCSGVAELVDETVGAVVPKGDLDAICNALEAAFNDDSALKAKANEALRRSREDRFKPEVINARFEEIYRRLVSRHEP